WCPLVFLLAGITAWRTRPGPRLSKPSTEGSSRGQPVAKPRSDPGTRDAGNGALFRIPPVIVLWLRHCTSLALSDIPVDSPRFSLPIGAVSGAHFRSACDHRVTTGGTERTSAGGASTAQRRSQRPPQP